MGFCVSFHFIHFLNSQTCFQSYGLLCFDEFVKVDRCMARLQELQYTVAGGRKMI